MQAQGQSRCSGTIGLAAWNRLAELPALNLWKSQHLLLDREGSSVKELCVGFIYSKTAIPHSETGAVHWSVICRSED